MFPLMPPLIQVHMQVKNLHFRLNISNSPQPSSLHLYLIEYHYLFYLLAIFRVCPNFSISFTTRLVQATMIFPLDYCSSLLIAGRIVGTQPTPSLFFTLQPKGCFLKANLKMLSACLTLQWFPKTLK